MDSQNPQPTPALPPQHNPTPGPVAAVPARRTGWRILIWLMVLALIAIFGLMLLALVFFVAVAGSQSSDRQVVEKAVEHDGTSSSATNKIAIITVAGAILNGDGFVKRQIDQAAKDDQVKAIVLRINSPGGTVTASDYLYHHLVKLRTESKKPIVVSMGGICASGGYYIAMAVGDEKDVVFAEPTTWTGSIGVIIPHYDLTGLLDKVAVKDDSLASGPLKEMGSPTKQFPPEVEAEQRKLLQQLVEISYEGFKDKVRAGRPDINDKDKDADGKTKLDLVATGQIFAASQAKEKGLVDKIDFQEAAIDRAIELAGLTRSNSRVVKYERPPSLLGLLMGVEAASQTQRSETAALLELTSPRAYYLYTLFPTLVTAGGE